MDAGIEPAAAAAGLEMPRPDPMPRSTPQILMTTAVWGDWHIEQLLALNLPTLLAPGNLPAFCRRCRLTYRIFTSEHDQPMLDAAPIIAQLRRIMPVALHLLPPEILSNPIAAHHHAWELATRSAAEEGRFVLFMPPDVAWSDGAFAHLADLLDRGLDAIFMTYLRVDQDLFIKAIGERPRTDDLAVAISSRELVALAFDCLHPLMAASVLPSRRIPIHPEMLFWPGPDRSLLLRVLAREFFLYDPSRFALNEARLADRAGREAAPHFISDSDELFAVSLAELGKDADWHSRSGGPDCVDIGRWWLNYDSPINDDLVHHKVRWHANEIDAAAWRGPEARSDRFIRRCAVAREGLRLRAAAHDLGCSRAARLIALALYSGMLARAVRGLAPATILLPTNAAFAALPPGWIESLCDPGNWRLWGRLLRAHCLPAGTPEGADGSSFRRGGALPPTLPDGIVSGPTQIGPHAVYLIDRLLLPP